jgi:site-specific DNA-methyltransferase (adenine-specific)
MSTATMPTSGIKPYYQDDAVTLYHGDCREILPTLGRFDLLLTDPPYGVTQQGWDSINSVRQIIASAPLSVFTTGERLLAMLITELPDMYRHIWVWDRVNHNTDFLNASRRPMRSHELIAVFSKEAQYKFEPVMRPGYHKVRQTQAVSSGNGTYGNKGPEKGYGAVKTELHPRSIIDFRGSKSNSQLHPTEKPVPLYEYLLQSYPADLTVDPWMGSGTTLVAAKNCGRKCIGIEMEERYCEIAANRLSQGVLF